ncbi:major facilitator superfamily domain-containing protein [Biscogniauxia mediterranea]|nr:major facilitator superfamily domain-containing protein [Biscogniauxia mediterranea]
MSYEKDSWVFLDVPITTPPSDDLHEVCLDDEAKENRCLLLPAGSRPECLKNAVHECLFVGLIAFAAATPVFLQRSIVVVAASIAQSLSMTPAQLAWSTASSGLTTGAFLLPFGHIADTFPVLPRKTLLIVSLAAFATLVACTSLSPNGIVLDVVSGLTGIACAANIPIALGILSLTYPDSSRRKNLVFSSFLMGTPAATIIGGLGSGALALEISWKAPFISLAALYAAVSALAWVLVPNVSEPPPVLEEKAELRFITERNTLPVILVETPRRTASLLQFDWVGLLLLLAGVLLFTISLTIGPEGPEPWKTPTVILLLTLGVLSFGCFILWENVTKTPMIPPSIWEDWSVTLVIICALCASMAFYSQLFWVSMFMQQLENLKPLDVAVRLLPQALMGLLFSPLVGLIMHKIPGTVLLAIAASSLVLSNVLLVFLRQGNNYLAWIFPSIMLSTVGLDWTMNVGSLFILSSLPLKHHSIGASLLQTTGRLGVPLGMAVTTAVWSSYDGNGDVASLELAYTNTFITTTAFSGLSLLLVPFIRIGKQGVIRLEAPDPEKSKPCMLLSPPRPPPPPAAREDEKDKEKSQEKEKENRPSKRWSPMVTLTPSMTGERPPTVAASVSSLSSQRTMDTHRTDTTARTTIQRGRSPSEKVVWVVCEECGTSKRHTESAHSVLGDPTRYFNDPACGGSDASLSGRSSSSSGGSGSGGSGGGGSGSGTGHHHHHHHHHHHPHHHQPQGGHHPNNTHQSHTHNHTHNQVLQRPPYGGRRRLPLVNRQIMTHQMLTQGFQP